MRAQARGEGAQWAAPVRLKTSGQAAAGAGDGRRRQTGSGVCCWGFAMRRRDKRRGATDVPAQEPVQNARDAALCGIQSVIPY